MSDGQWHPVVPGVHRLGVALEDLTPGARVSGLVPHGAVTILHTRWHGTNAVTVTYTDDAGRTMRALAATMERIEKGQGNVGRLLADEQMARDIEATVAQLRAAAAELGRVSKDLAELTRSAGAPDGVPSILRRADQALATLQGALRNVARATQSAPKITRNIESSKSPVSLAFVLAARPAARSSSQREFNKRCSHFGALRKKADFCSR